MSFIAGRYATHGGRITTKKAKINAKLLRIPIKPYTPYEHGLIGIGSFLKNMPVNPYSNRENIKVWEDECIYSF